MLIEISGQVINPYNIIHINDFPGGCIIYFNVERGGKPSSLFIGLDKIAAMHEINKKLNDCLACQQFSGQIF